MQPKLDRLDATIQGDVVEQLAELQRIHAPDLSIGDLIEQTGGLLTSFNGAIDDLSEGMLTSLGKLGDRIEVMMQEFGSFQQQYAQLNDLIVQLRTHGDNISDVTTAIQSAARTLQNPIDRFNQEIGQALERHMATVEQALAAQGDDRQAMQQRLMEVQRETGRTLADLRSLVSDHLDHNDDLADRVDAYIETMEARSAEQRQAVADELEARVKLLAEQSERIEAALQETAEALKAANSQDLARVLERMDEEVNTTAKRLSDVTKKMDGSAQRMDGSARELAKASAHLRAASDQPVTAFDWINRNVRRLRNGSNGQKH
jgi:chromosome segregation ATPase